MGTVSVFLVKFAADMYGNDFDMSPRGDRKGISVSQLAGRVRQTVGNDPGLQNQWVVAELTEVRGSGGHVYLELAEKDGAGNMTAKMRGMIWANVAQRMKSMYGSRMREIMRVGNEVMVKGSVAYSPLYSLAFGITDIDPEYRRDTSRLQAEILAALAAEGIAGENKGLSLCEAPQRIAVISAAGAAGYGDFVNQLLRNPYRLRFCPCLFAATMQGQNVSATVRAALDEIEMRSGEFDCVVIIRGGGATTDLAGFDEIRLARAVALFPLPVIVGIGHERDNTVLDFIAHTRVKTPTAAAEFLIARNAEVLSRVSNLARYVASYGEKAVHGEMRRLEFYEGHVPGLARAVAEGARSRLAEITAALPLVVRNRLTGASATLEAASRAVESAGQRRISSEAMRLGGMRAGLERDLQVALQGEWRRLEALGDKVRLLSPENVLARGYSMTLCRGRVVRRADDVAPGEVLVTRLHDGEISSTANS